MINAEELRIGNIIDSNGGLVTVIGIPYSKDLEIAPYPHNQESRAKVREVKPFTITEHWLPKIGLDETKLISSNEDKMVFWFSCGPFIRLIFIRNGRIKLVESNAQQLEIISLHHFQNVYYAMTGTELPIDWHINELPPE